MNDNFITRKVGKFSTFFTEQKLITATVDTGTSTLVDCIDKPMVRKGRKGGEELIFRVYFEVIRCHAVYNQDTHYIIP